MRGSGESWGSWPVLAAPVCPKTKKELPHHGTSGDIRRGQNKTKIALYFFFCKALYIASKGSLTGLSLIRPCKGLMRPCKGLMRPFKAPL